MAATIFEEPEAIHWINLDDNEILVLVEHHEWAERDADDAGEKAEASYHRTRARFFRGFAKPRNSIT